MKQAYLWVMLLLWQATLTQAQQQARPILPSPQAISFYVVAHPDDWQLFMSPNAYGDLTDTRGKIIFIYLTSGDDKRRTGYDSQYPYATLPYYQARERAAANASRFVTNQYAGGRVGPTSVGTTWVKSNYHLAGGRNIATYAYRNTVHYFLRLPDRVGEAVKLGGAGSYDFLTATALDSLVNDNQSVKTIDGSSSYANRTDVADQVAEIMQKEWTPEFYDTNYYPYRFLNYSEDHITDWNRPDHGDHINAAVVAEEAASSLGLNEWAFEGYSSASMPHNMSQPDAQNEASLFAITANSLLESGYSNTWDLPGHREYLGVSKSRQVTSSSRAAGAARVAPAAPATAPADMDIYPVPAAKQFHVRLPEKATGTAVLTVFNGHLQQVRQVRVPATSLVQPYTVDLTGVPAGVYYVEVKTDAKTYRRKLVKGSE
ncbi:T9SS type A sorting domain-containing protein [Hymenobacter sp. CRA2]|uniref:T9SS type A sorting domain-containing protein n=1 Tax=Hymenobacter sp. CRA2 TaxID=1955620 RepID=UPI0009D49734|nr:T9SS type A sorting domain-containing protein [Hymenobacter sp. CRA2]OON67852.1 hypothetical protein B0919_16875 [Hymenobacter sp. CRA2]